MADLIQEYLKLQMKQKEIRDKRNIGEEKRYTVTLSEYDYLRMAYVSRKLGLKRSTFSRDIILQALTHAEDVMKLNERDAEGEFTDYGLYINGAETGDEDSEDDEESGVKRTVGAPRGGRKSTTE